MFQTPSFEIRPYINFAWRRKWWIIVPFLLSAMGGAALLATTPKTYKASTLIMLEPQSIPDSFVRTTVSESMEGRLRTISQQINSRTNLESIIRDFELDRNTPKGRRQAAIELMEQYMPFMDRANSFARPADDEMNQRVQMLNLVDRLRSSIQVTTRGGTAGGGRGQTQAFEISLQWHDPEVIAPVTNAIAARFIEENLSAREEMAISTTDFLESETATLRVELERKERALEAFKSEHMGMLPDQLASNISIMNQLRDEMSNLERRLDQERQQVLFLRSQSEAARMERDSLRASMALERGGATGASRGGALTAEQFTSGSIDELERELKRLSTMYTERHPDILALKRRIETLQSEGQGSSPTEPLAPSRTGGDRASLQLATAMANMESHNKAIEDLQKQIEIYKWRIEQTPQIEMEQSRLLRDYETMRRRYEVLLANKMDAKLAEQLERRRKGEQFRVLDSAIKPSTPFSPDASRIMAMALALGLGLGGGLAYLREMLDPRFYSPEEVEDFLSAPVIVSLPLAQEKRKS